MYKDTHTNFVYNSRIYHLNIIYGERYQCLKILISRQFNYNQLLNRLVFLNLPSTFQEESLNDLNHKLNDEEDPLLAESISLTLVCSNHFVSVTMNDNVSLPYVASMWNVLQIPEAAA